MPLYLLACDHRRSFEKLLGLKAPASGGEIERLKDAKRVVWEGFRTALDDGLPAESAGFLTDLDYGEDVARAAKERGVPFALPIEQSGRAEFELDARLIAAVTEYEPTYVKALVRYNPEDDRELNARQRERLRHISDWLASTSSAFMLELLVPPTAAQLEAIGDDRSQYDAGTRPRLMTQAIQELQDNGVRPATWKIEGLDSADGCRAVSSLIRRAGGGDCVVLGRGASTEAVERWLLAAREVPGYVGFAIGRSIFADALRQLRDKHITRTDAITQIARNFSHFVAVYSAPAMEFPLGT